MNTKLSVSICGVLSLLLMSCQERLDPDAAVIEKPDKFDNTVWTAYHSNGVDIIAFGDHKCVNRFYDAITGDESTETNGYRVEKNYIQIMETDSTTYRMYYEITAQGKTLSFYKNEYDLNNNRPNVVFSKL